MMLHPIRYLLTFLIGISAVFVLFPETMWASGGSGGVLGMGSLRNIIVCTVNTTGSGSQDIAIANGDVEIASVAFYVKSTVLGVISSSVVTDDTTPSTLLGTTLLSGLTGGKNLTPFDTAFFLGSARKIKINHIGTASGGTILVGIEYFKGTGDITCL